MDYFKSTDILIPKENLESWAVIACDQYTSEPEYWQKVREIAGESPSAIGLMLPEMELGTLLEGEKAPDGTTPALMNRVREINASMDQYLAGDIFHAYGDSYIYLERTQPDGRIRRGILGAVDLEAYSYTKRGTGLIRSTEETVLERIPPRKAIRKDAALEMPHLMLLADDPEKLLIEPLIPMKEQFEKVYDFDLMQRGGHLCGYRVNDEGKAHIDAVLEKFADPEYFGDKYNSNGPVMALAVGDGNHSLASAKACYEALKEAAPEEAPNSPARYALAEIVNLHDAALDFEPIYRLLSGVDLDDFCAYLRSANPQFHAGGVKNQNEVSFYLQSQLERRTFSLPVRPGILPVAVLQPLLDAYLENHPEVSIDYIHGLDTVRNLAQREGNLAITFQGMQKEDLFPGIIHGGVLPRKTFSMGHADDKRFYLECRKIR